MVARYNDLEVFQLAYKFVLDLYPHLDKFPESEHKSLALQMRRAAVSLPTNIAEGSSRRTDREFLPFLYYSFGSAKELEVALKLSKDLGFLDEKAYQERDDQLQIFMKKLVSFMRYLEESVAKKKEISVARISRGEKPWWDEKSIVS